MRLLTSSKKSKIKIFKYIKEYEKIGHEEFIIKNKKIKEL